jgi:hypothetical protein
VKTLCHVGVKVVLGHGGALKNGGWAGHWRGFLEILLKICKKDLA